MIRELEAEFRARMHKALKFDGVDDWVIVSDNPSLDITDEITLIAWIYIQSIPSYASGIVSKGVGSDRSYSLIISNHMKIWFAINTEGSPQTHYSNATLSTGKFYQIGGTYKNGDKRIYINGSLDNQVKQTGVIHTNASYLEIGRYDQTFFKAFGGFISLVYIYDIALSEAEIKHLYYNPFDPPELEHLVLWLAPGSIDTANGKWWDLSDKGNHGTIYGATEVLLTEPEVAVV